MDLVVPPVLGIVLTRSARRDAIPTVIRDLRYEWSSAREKVWVLLDALRNSQTLGDALRVRDELSEASRLFSPRPADGDTRPGRVLWEIVAGAGAGAATGRLTGGSALLGALTGSVGQAARSLPTLAKEFGRTIFGRGAFDLARQIHREVKKVEFDSLTRILGAAEKEKLGLH